jgi:hypothetical protein
MRILLIISLISISQIAKSQDEILKFKSDDDGILVEVFDTLNKNENRYNLDNSIYTVNKKFYFDYYYLDTNNIKYLMTNDSTTDWRLKELDKKDLNSVNQVIMSISYGLSPFYPMIKDYNQTVIKYDFKMYNGNFWKNEMTGLIENKKNIWIHPPRTGLFKILELNPFPYLKSPYEIGNKWDWKLTIGSHWSDKRWLEWTGNVLIQYEYEIMQKLNLKTNIGEIDCFLIQGIAKSKLGTTRLISYFSEKYGFVKLEYTNIDRTKIIIEINKIE